MVSPKFTAPRGYKNSDVIKFEPLSLNHSSGGQNDSVKLEIIHLS